MKQVCVLDHWSLLDKDSPYVPCATGLSGHPVLLTAFSVGKEGWHTFIPMYMSKEKQPTELVASDASQQCISRSSDISGKRVF